jgi:hypothetical protein
LSGWVELKQLSYSSGGGGKVIAPMTMFNFEITLDFKNPYNYCHAHFPLPGLPSLRRLVAN